MAPARRRTEDGEVRLPADLAGPVEVALARSDEHIPAPHALPGGSRYEVKWDGYLHWTCPASASMVDQSAAGG